MKVVVTLTALNEANNIENVINELISYTGTHFADEEKLLNEINFPDLDEHKKLHSFFTHRIEQFRKDYSSGDLELSTHIMEFLWGWLLEHILMADKKYGEHFAKAPQPAE